MKDSQARSEWPTATIVGGPIDGKVFPIHGVGKTLRWVDPLPGGVYRLVSYQDYRAVYEWQPHEEHTHV